jgi:hypothetical protein
MQPQQESKDDAPLMHLLASPQPALRISDITPTKSGFTEVAEVQKPLVVEEPEERGRNGKHTITNKVKPAQERIQPNTHAPRAAGTTVERKTGKSQFIDTPPLKPNPGTLKKVVPRSPARSKVPPVQRADAVLPPKRAPSHPPMGTAQRATARLGAPGFVPPALRDLAESPVVQKSQKTGILTHLAAPLTADQTESKHTMPSAMSSNALSLDLQATVSNDQAVHYDCEPVDRKASSSPNTEQEAVIKVGAQISNHCQMINYSMLQATKTDHTSPRSMLESGECMRKTSLSPEPAIPMQAVTNPVEDPPHRELFDLFWSKTPI